MDFRQLQYMLTLAEYKNMTRASEALYISQSALSHYLKNVEQELGVTLFDRSTNPLSLTYAGKCYMEGARRILMENDRMLRELRDITHHMTGKLVIGTSRDRASYMMPRILPEFTARYPGIETEVFTASGQKLMEALRTGRVDMVLLPDTWKSLDSDLNSEPIYTEELVLAAKQGYLPEKTRLTDRTVSPRALADIPFFLLFQEHAMRTWCDAWFRKHRLKIEPRMEFSSNISCYRMAASGMGVTVIPYLTTRMTNPGGGTELFSLGKDPETWDVHILYRKNAYLGQPELDLIDISKNVFSNEMLSD